MSPEPTWNDPSSRPSAPKGPLADSLSPASGAAAATSGRSLSRRFIRQPVVDVLGGLEQLADTRRPGLLMLGMLLVGAVTWFVYVPIHELLHVAACVLAGGEVNQLEIQPHYGGNLLARVFPWVVADSDYAGRLSGFDAKGSDLIYLATDFGPFVLTVLFGVPLVKLCMRKRHPVLFPIAIVLGLAPFYNLPGDYFEMGSIMTTRATTWMVGKRVAAPPPPSEDPDSVIIGGDTDAAYAGLRSDDIYTLLAGFFSNPSKHGIRGVGHFIAGFVIILVSLAVALFCAFLTYWAGHLVAMAVSPRPPT